MKLDKKKLQKLFDEKYKGTDSFSTYGTEDEYKFVQQLIVFEGVTEDEAEMLHEVVVRIMQGKPLY